MFSGRLLSTSVSAKYFGSRRCPKSSLSGMKCRAEPRALSSTLFALRSLDNLGHFIKELEESSINRSNQTSSHRTKLPRRVEKIPSEKNSVHSSLTLSGTVQDESGEPSTAATRAARRATSRPNTITFRFFVAPFSLMLSSKDWIQELGGNLIFH